MLPGGCRAAKRAACSILLLPGCVHAAAFGQSITVPAQFVYWTNYGPPQGSDAPHRLTAIPDHKGNRIDYTLDAMGNRTAEQVTDPGGVLVKNIARVIDALNRVERITGTVQ